MNLYKICSFSPTIFHLHLHLYTDLNISVFWKWVGRSVCIHLISKKVIYTPQAATMKSHEGSMFGAWVASDILFLSLCWTPLMQRKSEKSVKILAARQSKMTFSFVLFAVCVASTARAKFLPQVHVWKGMFAMEPPWLDFARNPCWIRSRNAPVVGWLLQWFPLWSSSLFLLGLPKKKKKKGVFHPSLSSL